VEQLLSTRRMKEQKLFDATREKEFRNTLKRELELLKREERLENVARIAKANEYQQQKIKQKIDFDIQRGDALMAEKKELLETRFSVRREAEKQKRTLLEKVERMKKGGDFSKEKLAELGLADMDDFEIS
jgi:hypothetical protein